MIENFKEEEAEGEDVHTHHLDLLDKESILSNLWDANPILDLFQPFDH